MPDIEIAQNVDAPPDDSWRSHLSAQMDKAEIVEAPAAAPTTSVAKAAPVEPAPEVATADSRPRDDKGRFTSGEAAPALPAKPEAPAGVAAPATAIGSPAPAAPVPTLEIKAPQSWKPEEKALWDKLPAETRAVIVRRERQMEAGAQKALEVQRTVDPLLRAVQPHLQGLQARGLVPVQVISNMLQTEQALSHPDERVRAKVFAQALKTYGVGVEALAAAIDGAPQGQPQAPQFDEASLLQKAKAAVMAELGQQRMQTALQGAQSEYSKAEGGEWGEFLAHPDMGETIKLNAAAILEAAATAGVDKGLSQAIEEACWAVPEVRKILQQREASKKAATSAEDTQRARAAGSSVRSSPASPVGAGEPADDSWRAHLAAAMDKVSGKV